MRDVDALATGCLISDQSLLRQFADGHIHLIAQSG